MSIITKPSTVNRGAIYLFDLSKTELAAHVKVSADGYFSNSVNWKSVILNYKSTARKQYTNVRFNTEDVTPQGKFSVSLKSLGDFEIESLTINDFDGGTLDLYRSELTVAEFDVDIT